MGNCIVVVQFDLPKRTEEQAIKGGTSTAPIYRGLAAKGLIRKDYLNGDIGTGGVYLWESRDFGRSLVYRGTGSGLDQALRRQAASDLVRYACNGR